MLVKHLAISVAAPKAFEVARPSKTNATLIRFRQGYSVTGRAPLQYKRPIP
jgi:hypothetical protein